MMKQELYKKENGVTLIILVVTIAVILILAGITVDYAFKDSGIIKTALGLQNEINSRVQEDKQRLNQLQAEIINGSYDFGSGLIPDYNSIIEGGGESGGDETTKPSAPKVEVTGTQGELGYYNGEVNITITANDRDNTLTYTVEGTGIDQGSVSTETSIVNGQSVYVNRDGAYIITAYEYNRYGQKSEGTIVAVIRDTVTPTGTLQVTSTEKTSIHVQLVGADPEPSGGLASRNPYTFYYKAEGTTEWTEAGKGSSSFYTYENLQKNTTYTLKADITDRAGNTGSSNELENVQTGGKVDETKPGIGNVTQPTKDVIRNGDTTEIILTPTEEVTVDPSKFIPVDENGNAIDATITVKEQQDGTIQIIITAGEQEGEVNIQIQSGGITDKAGNTNDTIMIDTNIVVDNTKPIMDMTYPEEGTVMKEGEHIDIILTPSEEVTIDPYKVTITGEGSTGATIQVTENPDGTIIITVIGGTGTGDIQVNIEQGFITDKAGNTNYAVISPTYKIDNIAPTINSYQVTGTTTNSITVAVDAEDVGGAGLATKNTYTYYISTDSNFPAGSTEVIARTNPNYTFENLDDATTYYTKVEVQDRKGNTATSQTISDETGSIPDGQGTIGFTTLTWENGQASTTVSKQTSLTSYTLQYQVLDAQGNTITDWTEVTGDSQEITGLLHGYTVNARLADTAGNTGKNATLIITDSTAPRITLQEQATQTKGNVTVTATIVEKESGIQVQKYAVGNRTIDYFQTAGTAFAGPPFEANANGIWTVYAEDKAGNKTVQTITVTKKDNTAPTTENIEKPTEETPIQKGDSIEIIITPSEDVTVDESKFIPVDENSTPTDADVTVEKQEDGTIKVTITGGEDEGPVDIVIQPGGMTDEAGNTNEEIKIDTNITVDNTKPTTSIQKPADGTILKNGETTTITITPSEDVTVNTDKIIVTGDGSTGANIQVTENADGTITITITGGTGTGDIGIALQPGALTDKAGNTNDTIAYEKVVEIDNHAPNVSAEVTGQTTSTVTVEVTASDVGPAGLATQDTYTYHIKGEGVDKTVTTTDTSYTFNNLTQGQDYTITVTVKDSKNNIATSSPIVATTEEISQGNIEIGTVTWNNEQASVDITKLSEVTGYTLQYKVTNQEGNLVNDWTNVTGNYITIENLLHNYTVEARLVDAGGNTGDNQTKTILDRIAPTISLAEPSTPTSGNVTITATITEKESGIQVQKYAVGNQTTTYFQTAGTEFTGNTFEATENGTWTVYVEDKAGNQTVKTITVTKQDKAKPTVENVTKPTEETHIQKGETVEMIITPSENVTIDLSKFIPVDENGNAITDPETNVNIYQDEDGNIHITIIGGEQEGEVNIQIQPGAMTDAAGNTNDSIIIDTNTVVDNTKPTTTIQKPADGTIIKNGETITVTLTPSEDVTVDTSKIVVTGDGSENANIQVRENADGTITVTITGGTGTGEIGIQIQEGVFTDHAGNTNTAITETIVQIDNQGPTVEAQVTNQTTSSVTVAVTATDNGLAGLETENTYTYHITGDGVDKTYTTSSTTHTFTNLPDGKDCTITVTATDTKGNTGSDSITTTIGSVPEGSSSITLSSITWNGNGNPTQEGTAKITLTNNETDFSMQYQVAADQGTVVEANWQPVTGNTIEIDGLYHNDIVYARLVDEAGNTGSVTSSTVIDYVAPVSRVTLGVAGNVSETGWGVSADLIEPGGNGSNDAESGVKTITYAITNGDNIEQDLATSLRIQEDGIYEIEGYVRDWAGNTKTKSFVAKIDTTNPTITQVTKDKSEPTNGTVTIAGTAQDTVSGIWKYQYSTYDNLTEDSTGWIEIEPTTQEYTAPSYPLTQNGTYYFYVMDQAGHTTKQSIEVISFDTEGPVINSVTKTPDTWTNQPITIEVEAVDTETGIVAYQFSTNEHIDINSSDWQNIHTTTEAMVQSIEVNQNDIYYFYVQDRAGNITQQPIEIDYIDTTLPTVNPITYTPQEWVKTGVTLTATAQDQESGIKAWQFSTQAGLTQESEGWNTLEQATTEMITQTWEVTINNNYYFYALDQAGNIHSRYIQIENIDQGAPVINNFAVTTNTTNSISVAVQAEDSQSGLASIGAYTYYISETGEFTEGVTTNENTYTYTELAENTTYYCKVEVRDAVGNTASKGEDGSISKQTGEIPSADQYITIGTVVWDNNGNPQTEGTAKIDITRQASVSDYTMVYKILEGTDVKQDWTAVTENNGDTTTVEGLKHADILVIGFDDGYNIGIHTKTLTIADTNYPTAGTLFMQKQDENGETYTSNDWTNQNIYVTGQSGTDAESGIKTYSVNNGSQDVNLPTTIEDEGTTTLTLNATDWAGLSTSDDTAYTIKIDKTPPTVGKITMKTGTSSYFATTYTSGSWASNNVYVSQSNGSDNTGGSGHSKTSYTITGGSYNGTTEYTNQTTISAAGRYTVTITTTDNAGNSSSQDYSVNIDKGNTTSVTSLTSGVNPETGKGIAITGTGQSTVSGIIGYQYSTSNYVTANSAGWIEVEQTTESFTAPAYPVSSNGIYYFNIKDAAGNVAKKSIAINSIDSNAPTISTVGNPSLTHIKSGQTATYSITMSEEVTIADSTKATVTGTGSTGCTVDITGSGTSWIATVTGGSGNGAVTLNLAAGLFQDASGNVTTGNSTKTGLTIDNTAPTIQTFATTAVENKSITVAVTATDNTGGAGLATTGTYTYYISETDTFTSGTSSAQTTHTFTGLTVGKTYYIAATAKDKLGNTSQVTDTNATITQKVVDTPPEGTGNITISNATWNGNGSTTSEGTAKITLTNTQTDYTMQYQVVADQGSPVEANWIDVTGSSIEVDGVYHNDMVYARLKNAEGLTGSYVSGSIVDKTNPTAGTLTMKTGTSSWNQTTYTSGNWTTNNVSVTLNAGSDAQSGVKTNTVSNVSMVNNKATISTEGSTKLTVTTTDWAGLSSNSTTYTINIDKTAPTISSLTENTTNKTIQGVARDTVSGIVAYQYNNSASPSSSGWNTITATTNSFTAPAYSVSAGKIYYFHVKDQAGNVGTQSITIEEDDTTAPTITAVGNPSKTYIKSGATATYSITTSESVTIADSSKATVTGTGSTGCTVAITGSGTSWTATVTGGTGNGAVTLSLAAGLFKDAAGNTTAAKTKTGLTIDNTAPVVTISPSYNSTVAKSTNVTITITETGSGLASTNTYKYYIVDASNTTSSFIAQQQGTYTSGTAITIGEGLTGDQYSLMIPVVSDQAGNTSKSTVEYPSVGALYATGYYKFDNSPPTISNFVLDNITTASVDISITAKDQGSAGIETYPIYYKADGESTYSVYGIALKSSITISDLEPNTTYSICVAARDTLGNESEMSSAKTITTLAYDGSWDSTQGVNRPYLYDDLNPVIWVNGTQIKKYRSITNRIINENWTDNNGDSIWYDYATGSGDHKTSRWANAVDSNGSYYVWIPRYEYKITAAPSTSASSTNTGTIAVNFIGKSKTTATSGYTIHPAFCKDLSKGGYGQELSGIWVTKYEVSNVNSQPVSKPNTISWTDNSVGEAYTNAYNYNRNMDSHLIKNSEWGAVAYLAHSPYGRNANAISRNFSSSYYTGGNNYVSNTAQSTTGNITGVYDMSGGAYEYVAAWDAKSTSNFLNLYGSSFATSGGNSTKYATAYSIGTTTGISYYPTSSKCIVGDATYEVNVNPGSSDFAWLYNYSCCAYSAYPFFSRGGHYDDIEAGAFYSNYHDGDGERGTHSYRVVLPGV